MPAPGVVEPQVRFFSPMPKDYQFVPKGDVYITGNVRRRTHAAGATLYVVVDKRRKPLGLRCPKSVYQEVTDAARASAESRAAAVQSRDAAVEHQFKTELVRLFPGVPRQDVPKILRQTLEKRSRRVGRTGKLDLDAKVRLAVKAHIRHCCTPYEQLLKDGVAREKARSMVNKNMDEVARLWMGHRLGKDSLGHARGRKETHNGQPRTSKKTRETEGTSRPLRKLARGDPELPQQEQSVKEGSVEEGNGDKQSDGNVIIVSDDDDSEESGGGFIIISDDDSEDGDWNPESG